MPQDSSNNPLSVLYKDLINDNWDLPSEQEFIETYSNPDNLKLLRSDLINDNWELPEEEEFVSTYLVQDLKKKEVSDSPSNSSQEVTPSPSKQVDVKDLVVPQAIQNELNPQKEFNPEDFQLMVEQNKKQKLDKALEASKPVQTETSDVISQQAPIQSAEEMVAKDESIRDDEKLTANQLVKNKEKYNTITKSLEDKIRDIPASELPNLYDAFDDETKEFLDFQTKGEKDAFIDLLAQKREEVLDNQIKEYQVNELESFKPTDEGMTDQLKQELALTKQKEENLSKGLSRIQEYTGLSGDDLVAFKQKVSEYNKLLESSQGGDTLTPEQKSKLNSLREDIKKVTEIQGDFYDPITGELSPEYTKEVLDTQEAIVGEYKNDYTKMSDRHAYLASKLRMLEKEANDITSNPNFKGNIKGIQGLNQLISVAGAYTGDDYNKVDARAKEIKETYKEAMTQFDALNRALLLNEDPSKVERGFLSAMGESLYEGLIGETVTDNDYRKNIIAQAQEAGIEINEEKAEELQDTFTEKLGETLGSSTAIGAEIAVTSFLTGGVAGALGAAGKSVPYLNRMYKVYQTNKKAAKVMDKAYDIIKSGVDFELASDETSFAMGAAEKSVGDLSEYLIKKLAGGKLGAFTKLFTRVGGRIVGGTSEEYGGDLADNLAEFGFTEQAIKETFGEGEEGLEKLYLIMAMSGGFGLPTEAVSFFKDKSAEIKAKRQSGGTVSESEAELESYIDQVIGEDNTTPDTSDITPEKQEALKEAGINLESEPISEQEVTEEVEPSVEEELTALAEKYKADPEAVKAELGITEEPTATEEVVVEDSPVVEFTEEELTSTDPTIIESAIIKVQDIQKKLDDFGQGNLSMGLPVVAAKAILKTVELGLKAGLSLQQAFEQAKTKFKESKEFNNLSEDDKKSLLDSKLEDFNKSQVDTFSETLQKQGIEKSVADKMATQFVENQNKKAQAKLDKKNLIDQAKESFKEALKTQEREFASEAAFKVLERSDLYNSLTKEEQAELKAQVEKFTSYKPKAEVSKEEKVETTKKQLLLDRIKNLKEGGDTLLKNVKDTKKELAKIIKGLQPDLTKEQYRQLVKVLQSTNTSEDLNSSISKIDNIVKYGKANPTTADIIQGEVKATEEFTEEQISELVYSEIERNNKQVKREDLKTIKEVVKSLNLTASSLGKVSGAQVISLIKAMKKIDLSTTKGLAELRGRLEKQRSNNFQAKLKAAFKNSRTGNKGSLAARLMNVDPNLINDYDTYNAVASALINSNKNKEYVIEGKTYSGAEIATKIEELEKQAEQNKADLEQAKAEVREKLLKEQYKKSSFSQGNLPILTFDEYASLVDSQNAKAKEQASLDRLNKRLNDLAERRDELKNLLKNSKQRLKDYISNDPNMSTETKRMLNSLVKFLSSDSNIENLVGDKGEVNKLTKDMLQAIEEVLAFNSTAAITSAAAVSNAINKSNELAKLGKIFRDNLVGIRLANKMASLDTAITFASLTVDQSNEFIAQVLADLKASSARARFFSVQSNKEIERLVSRARMSPEKSQLMGMVSFFTQENANWYSFEEKKAIIEGQIKVLGENNENNKYVKSLEKTYEQLKDFNSLEELNDALDKTEILQEELDTTLKKIKELKEKYNNTSDKKLKEKYTKEIDNNLEKAKDIKKSLKEDTLFNQKEKDVLNYVRDQFKELEPKLRESNYNNKGIETESYSNYTPLYTHTLGDRGKIDTEAVLEDNMFTNKLDTKESSRTISRRKSTPGNVAYNFDFVESAKAGLYDAVYDIETLFDRKTLANLMKTQGYKDLFKTKQGDQFAGYALNLINERIKQYANAKTPSKPSDRMKSDTSAAIRITQSILRNIIAYPLKNVGQIFKQTIPIATQVGIMLMNHPVKFLTSFKEVKTEDFLNSELYKSSASGTRLAGGEVAFDKTGSPIVWLLRKLYNPEGKGNKVSRAYEENLSEVLTTSDNFINRVSLLAFYKAEAEKAGIPVDYNRPDPKVLAKAQVEASRINNVSDPAEMGELFAAQGKDAKDLKFLSQAFFMYKSFAVNAALNATINIRNLTTKPKATDLKRLAGALAGVIAFNMIGQIIRDQVKKVASDAINRGVPKDEDKTIPEHAIEQMSKGLFDLFAGILPNFSENSVKEAFNQVYAEGYELATDEKLEKKPYYTEEGYNIMQLMLVTDYIDNTASIVQAISDSDSGLSDKEKAVLIAKFLGNVGFEGNIKMFTEGVSRDILKEYEKLKK